MCACACVCVCICVHVSAGACFMCSTHHRHCGRRHPESSTPQPLETPPLHLHHCVFPPAVVSFRPLQVIAVSEHREVRWTQVLAFLCRQNQQTFAAGVIAFALQPTSEQALWGDGDWRWMRLLPHSTLWPPPLPHAMPGAIHRKRRMWAPGRIKTKKEMITIKLVFKSY